MNINLKLTIPLINEETMEERNVTVIGDTLLFPFYCLESDVSLLFTDVTVDHGAVRQIIFNNSIKVDNLSRKVTDLRLLSEDELNHLKRDFTVCLSTNDYAKKAFADNKKAISQSKTLGDFTVSTSATNDNLIISKIISDSDECIAALTKLLKDIEDSNVLPSTFVKGRYNSQNIQANDRLWWLKDLGGMRIKDGYASEKYWFNGNQYKAALRNRG